MSPLDSARDDKGKLESKVMPEPESQEMLCRKPLEARFKNKKQFTSNTEPILEIRSSALRECKMMSVECKMKSVECKMLKTGKLN